MKVLIILHESKIKLLVNSNYNFFEFKQIVNDIIKLNKLKNNILRCALDDNDYELLNNYERLKNKLGGFILDSDVVGWPFDNHDAELFALDRKLEYFTINYDDLV